MDEQVPQTTEANQDPTTGQWPGAFSLVQRAFKALSSNKQFLYVYVGAMTFMALLAYINKQHTNQNPFLHNGTTTSSSSGLSVVGLQVLVSLILAGPLLVYVLDAARSKEQPVADIFKKGLSRLLPLIGAGILVGIIVVIGSILLIVPGIYALLRLAFVSYLVVDKGMGPVAALKESWRMTNGNMSKVAGYYGVTIVVGVVASIIGAFIPVVGQAAVSVVSVALAVIGVWLYDWATKHPVTQ